MQFTNGLGGAGLRLLVSLSDAFPAGATVKVTHGGTAALTIDLPATMSYDDVNWHAFNGWMTVNSCQPQYADYCQDTITFTYGDSSKSMLFTVYMH